MFQGPTTGSDQSMLDQGVPGKNSANRLVETSPENNLRVSRNRNAVVCMISYLLLYDIHMRILLQLLC